MEVDSKGGTFNLKISSEFFNLAYKFCRFGLTASPSRGVGGAFGAVFGGTFMVGEEGRGVTLLMPVLAIRGYIVLQLKGQTVQLLAILKHSLVGVVQVLSDIDKAAVLLLLLLLL